MANFRMKSHMVPQSPNVKWGPPLQALNKKQGMLVVASEVDPTGLLAWAALPSVAVIKFDTKTDSTAQLNAKIEKAFLANGSTKFKAIAFATHGARGGIWQLTSDCKCNPSKDGYISDIMPVMSALAKCSAKTEGGRIDLLGCDLFALDPQMPTKLEKTFKGINFTTSDDKTGNAYAGGDWVMESDNIDISRDYFDAARLQKYDETMGWSINLGFIAIGDFGTRITINPRSIPFLHVDQSPVKSITQYEKWVHICTMAEGMAGEASRSCTVGYTVGASMSGMLNGLLGISASLKYEEAETIKKTFAGPEKGQRKFSQLVRFGVATRMDGSEFPYELFLDDFDSEIIQ